MYDPQHVAEEIALAMEEGIIDATEAKALHEEALRANQSPLMLLEAQGVLSPQTRQRLEGGGQTVSSTQQPNSGPYQGEVCLGLDFPLTQWDRYQPEHFLGQGGMGRVFLAWDGQLQRKVAVKFLKNNRRKDAKRLIREARAQARIQHERVCQVYEVHEEEGHVFIAMEYIDGAPLSKRGADWTLKTYINLIRDIALGLHAAHEAGLIHRDIKPGNIMVRCEKDETPKAILMDFGLAMAWTEEDTLAWSAGTPSFMPPEQALGQEGCLDPRSDVYSLGATLYWCLCNRPPIMGKNSLDTISLIPREEPPDPQTLNPDINRDLSLIIKKCLRKERADRYPSAKAFADDLAAYLAGDAVSVRGADWWYLTRKKLRQNKVAAVAVAALLLMFTALSLNTQHLQRQAEEREQWARRFSEAAEEIEATIRFSHMLPAHDSRIEMQELRQRIADMEEMRREAGPLGHDAADFAIGRAYAAFDDHRTALRYLEQAWENGYRLPAVAYAIAQSLGERYNNTRLTAEMITDPSRRERAVDAAHRRYAARAATLLQAVPPSSTRFPAYVEAQMAWFAKKPRRSLEILRQHSFPPWFYENYRLQGALYVETANQLRNRGHKEDAEELFEKGQFALAKAVDIAPSSIENYLALAKLMGYQYDYYHFHSSNKIQPYLEQGLAGLETALRIDPTSKKALIMRAELKSLSFLAAGNQGDLDLNELNREIDIMAAVTDSGYFAFRAGQSYLRLLIIRANTRANKMEDPSEDLRTIFALSERIPPEERTDNVYQLIGQAHQIAAKQDLSDQARLTHIEAASRAYESAVRLAPQTPRIRMSLGLVYLAKKDLETGAKKQETLNQVIDTFSEALALDNKSIFAHYYLGNSLRNMAWSPLTPFAMKTPLLEEALCHYQRAEEIRPKVPNFAQSQAMVWWRLADQQYAIGDDYRQELHEAEKAVLRAIKLNPKYGYSYSTALVIQAKKARAAAALAATNGNNAQQSRDYLNQSLNHMPNNKNARRNFAMSAMFQALAAVNQGQKPGPFMEEARLTLQTLLNEHPDYEPALLSLLELEVLELLLQVRLGTLQPDTLATTLAHYQQVDLKEPFDEKYHSVGLRLAFLRAVTASDTTLSQAAAAFQTKAGNNRAYDAEPNAAVAMLLQEWRVWHALKTKQKDKARAAYQQLKQHKTDFPSALVYTFDLRKTLDQQKPLQQF